VKLIERIHDRVARHGDPLGGDALTSQVPSGKLCWRKVQRREGCDRAAVFFFGKRASHITASKPCLDVRHWNAALSGGPGRCNASAGVALHDDEVGALQQVRVVQLTAQLPRHLG
jgi:hypothetical protein